MELNEASFICNNVILKKESRFMYYLTGTALTCRRHKRSYRPGQGDGLTVCKPENHPCTVPAAKAVSSPNITCIWMGHGPGTQLTYMIENRRLP